MNRISLRELLAGALKYPPVDVERPQTREECRGMERPCPFVACKHHLYLDVNPETGTIKINFPDLEPWELKETCALDVAERGGITLEEVGEIMNLTRERIRQVEVIGLMKLKVTASDNSSSTIGASMRSMRELVASMKGQPTEDKRKVASEGIGRARKPPTCSRCGEVGHKRQLCPKVGIPEIDDRAELDDEEPVSCPPEEDPAASVG